MRKRVVISGIGLLLVAGTVGTAVLSGYLRRLALSAGWAEWQADGIHLVVTLILVIIAIVVGRWWGRRSSRQTTTDRRTSRA
jgi:hypothetical protein